MEVRTLKPTTPRKRYVPHRYLAIEETIAPSQRHVGMFYWCAYWGHWDKILAVSGMWVTVAECNLAGELVGRVRKHCTGMHPCMFADKPFPVTHD